ncbi:MAG: cation diffusion facilitator family transporter [Planctomycetota bacterium]|nr:cation diffusion facilitator family transporter [Planctomycetota bacterium]MDG2142308.1 cation diffusion facilitator family transporter [Planctomycetota bacterium]
MKSDIVNQVDPTGPLDEGVGHQAHRLCLVTNGLLAAMKLGTGFLFASPALVADGWHSAADTISSGIAWVGYKLGSEPADEDHHYGHGNLEALGGLIVGLVLVVGGGGVVASSFFGELEAIEEGGEVLAMCVALVSILVNLGLAGVTGRAANRVGSISLRALTWDNLGDALSSTIVLVAIGARAAGYPAVEGFVAGAIGVLIMAMGLRSVRAGFDVLMDRVADPKMRFRIAETARRVEGVRGVKNVRIHPLGSDVRVDLEINIDGDLTVSRGHTIAHAVEDAVRDSDTSVQGVHVHMNPCEPDVDLGAGLFGGAAPARPPSSPKRATQTSESQASSGRKP